MSLPFDLCEPRNHLPGSARRYLSRLCRGSSELSRTILELLACPDTAIVDQQHVRFPPPYVLHLYLASTHEASLVISMGLIASFRVLVTKQIIRLISKAMATPTTFFVPDLEIDALTRALRCEEENQRKATPSPTFANPDTDQSYDYLCEIEHSKYSSQEVERMRRSVDDTRYWKREAQCYRVQLTRRMDEQLVEEYSRHRTSQADIWRNIAMAYTRRLKRRGLTAI